MNAARQTGLGVCVVFGPGATHAILECAVHTGDRERVIEPIR